MVEVKRECGNRGYDHVRFLTDEPLGESLSRFLHSREAEAVGSRQYVVWAASMPRITNDAEEMPGRLQGLYIFPAYCLLPTAYLTLSTSAHY